MQGEVDYTFSIVNFNKPDSQYSVGMKPVLYSTKVVLPDIRSPDYKDYKGRPECVVTKS